MKFTDALKNVCRQIKSLIKVGILTILPLTLTFVTIKFCYSMFSQWLMPFGLQSIVLVFCGLIIIGFLGQFILAEAIINPLEKIIDNIPLVRVLYFGIKSVVDFFNVANNPDIERKVVLIEYPKKGTYHIAFLIGCADGDYSKLIPRKNGVKMVKVFMPTTHLTSGFFLILDKQEVISTDISFEEAIKAIVSGGLISPTSLHEIKFEDFVEDLKNKDDKNP